MPTNDYESVSLPKDMLAYIDKLRATDYVRRKYYFTSRAQFIRYAITHFFEKIRDESKNSD